MHGTASLFTAFCWVSLRCCIFVMVPAQRRDCIAGWLDRFGCTALGHKQGAHNSRWTSTWIPRFWMWWLSYPIGIGCEIIHVVVHQHHFWRYARWWCCLLMLCLVLHVNLFFWRRFMFKTISAQLYQIGQSCLKWISWLVCDVLCRLVIWFL